MGFLKELLEALEKSAPKQEPVTDKDPFETFERMEEKIKKEEATISKQLEQKSDSANKEAPPK